MSRALLYLFQDASSSTSATTWIPIVAQFIIAIVGWAIVWRIARKPVQVIVLPAQPEEKAKKTTAHKVKVKDLTPDDERVIRALPFLLPVPIVNILMSALELYELFTYPGHLGKTHLLLTVNSTFWICIFAALFIMLLHMIKTYKPMLSTEGESPAPEQLEAHDSAADVPARESERSVKEP